MVNRLEIRVKQLPKRPLVCAAARSASMFAFMLEVGGLGRSCPTTGIDWS